MSAPATSGAKPPTLPLSKARRELAELLEHARTIEADGDTTRLLSQDSPTSGEGGGPQIARWGVKINDEYCIIAARKVDEDRRLRFDVYNTRTSTQHALVCVATRTSCRAASVGRGRGAGHRVGFALRRDEPARLRAARAGVVGEP